MLGWPVRQTAEALDGSVEPFGIGVLLVRDGRITEIVAFHEPALFPSFNLPPTPDR